MNDQLIREVVLLEPTSLVELFIIDVTPLGGKLFYFHNSTISDEALGSNQIKFQGVKYERFPFKAEGFELSSSGEIPTPSIAFSNVLGTFTTLALNYRDLLGVKITRKRTFAKFLDNQPGADSSAEFPPEYWHIDRKISEDKNSVMFELGSVLDVDGLYLPKRIVYSNLCPWKYRSSECGYSGVPKTDGFGVPFQSVVIRGPFSPTATYSVNDSIYINLVNDNNRRQWFVAKAAMGTAGEANRPPNGTLWTADECLKSLKDCKLHFGETAELNYGGFPGTARMALS